MRYWTAGVDNSVTDFIITASKDLIEITLRIYQLLFVAAQKQVGTATLPSLREAFKTQTW